MAEATGKRQLRLTAYAQFFNHPAARQAEESHVRRAMKRPRRSGTFNSDAGSARNSAASSPGARSFRPKQSATDAKSPSLRSRSRHSASSFTATRRAASREDSNSAATSTASIDSRRSSFADVTADGGGDEIDSKRPLKRKRVEDPTSDSQAASSQSLQDPRMSEAAEPSPMSEEAITHNKPNSEKDDADVGRTPTSETASDPMTGSREGSIPLQNGHSSNLENAMAQNHKSLDFSSASLSQQIRRARLQHLRMETPVDSIGATSGQGTPMLASPTEQDQDNDQDLADEQNAASGKPSKPLKRLPGRRRAPHPDHNVEADLRRQLQLKVGYRAVAKALKPLLQELATRTIDAIQENPEEHRESDQYKIVQAQLDARYRERVNALDQAYAIKTKNARDLRNKYIDRSQTTCKNTIMDLQDDYIIRAEHKILLVLREAKFAHDDGSMTVDEDDIPPRLRGIDGPLSPKYDSRSRFFIESEKMWAKEDSRESFAMMVKEHLLQNSEELDLDRIRDLDDFVGFDDRLRQFAVASANIRALAQAAESVEAPSSQYSQSLPSIISNHDAQGLQLLAELLLQSGPVSDSQRVLAHSDSTQPAISSQAMRPYLSDNYAAPHLQAPSTPPTTRIEPIGAHSESFTAQQGIIYPSSDPNDPSANAMASPQKALSVRKRYGQRKSTRDGSAILSEAEMSPQSHVSTQSSVNPSSFATGGVNEETTSKSNKITDLLNDDVPVKRESPAPMPYPSPNGQSATAHIVSPVAQRIQQPPVLGFQETPNERISREQASEPSAEPELRSPGVYSNLHQPEVGKSQGQNPTKQNDFWSALTTPSNEIRKDSVSRQTRYEALLRSNSKAKTRTPERTSSQPSDTSSDHGQSKPGMLPPRARAEAPGNLPQISRSQSPTAGYKGHHSSNSLDRTLRPWSRGADSTHEKERRASAPQQHSSQTSAGSSRFSPLAPHPGPQQQQQYQGPPPAQQQYNMNYPAPSPTQYSSRPQYTSPYNQPNGGGSGYTPPSGSSPGYWQGAQSSPQLAPLPAQQPTPPGASFQPPPGTSFTSGPADTRFQTYTNYSTATPPATSAQGPPSQTSQSGPPRFGQQYGGQPILPANMDPRNKQYNGSPQYGQPAPSPAFPRQNQAESSQRQYNDQRRPPSEPKSRQKNRQQHEFKRYSGPPPPRS